jgi:hypothetical protein
MDSLSLNQVPKFDRERKHSAVWLIKATAVWALNEVRPALKPGFKDMLPVNDTIPLDNKKPNEFQFILNKTTNDKIKCKLCRWIAILDGPLLDYTSDKSKCNFFILFLY